MLFLQDNPCKFPRSDPRYIDPNELKNAPLELRLRYRDVCAREDHNKVEAIKADAETAKLEILIKVAKYSVLGTIGASLIGAGTLLYTQHSKPQTRREGHIYEGLAIQLGNIETRVIDIERTVKSDHNFTMGVRNKINDLHRKEYPEQYVNEFGYYKVKKK